MWNDPDDRYRRWFAVFAQRWQWRPHEVDALTLSEFDAFARVFEQMARDEDEQRREAERAKARGGRR